MAPKPTRRTRRPASAKLWLSIAITASHPAGHPRAYPDRGCPQRRITSIAPAARRRISRLAAECHHSPQEDKARIPAVRYALEQASSFRVDVPDQGEFSWV